MLHPEGPWSFDGHGINDKSSEYTPRIATLSPHYKAPLVGNLMAAAPELLEALEEFVTQSAQFASMAATRDKARAAIAKARGE